jgi:hypothetical protein
VDRPGSAPAVRVSGADLEELARQCASQPAPPKPTQPTQPTKRADEPTPVHMPRYDRGPTGRAALRRYHRGGGHYGVGIPTRDADAGSLRFALALRRKVRRPPPSPLHARGRARC